MTAKSERTLVEQPTIQLFGKFGWETMDAMHENPAPGGSFLGKESKDEVVLTARLRPALKRLKPDLPGEAIEELTRDQSLMLPVNANR